MTAEEKLSILGGLARYDATAGVCSEQRTMPGGGTDVAPGGGLDGICYTFVPGGRDHAIPGADMNFDWNIVAPFGVETIMAIATATKNPGLFEFRPGKDVAFRRIGDENIRGLEVVAKQMTASVENLPADQKAEKVIKITTVGEGRR